MMNFVLKTRNCVSKTRNCVLKTRNCVFKMMKSAAIPVKTVVGDTFEQVDLTGLYTNVRSISY